MSELPSGLPTGTVTLLLADVEGSTRLWETQPEEMAAAVARLDQHCPTRSPPTMACARSSRARATASSSRSPGPLTRWPAPWICNGRRWRRSGCASACTPARCSCATRKMGNYIGPTINRTARLRDLAHGGQTVLSGATEELVVDQLPADAWLTDLGAHPLRDLPRPERVVQLCHPDLRNDFPPLRTHTNVAAHNLPAQLTSFIGRQAEIGQPARGAGRQSAGHPDRGRRGGQDPAGRAGRRRDGG